MRDDFPEAVKRSLANRVANHCSRCQASTSGPQSDPSQALNVGVAAHITAASPGGPRYDPALTQLQRGSAENGVWLCQTCGKLVDNDPAQFTAEQMREWKSKAEAEALSKIGRTPSRTGTSERSAELQVKRDLMMKKRVEKDFLRRSLPHPPKNQWEKLAHSEVVIHCITDTSYPEIDPSPGMSGWQVLEVWNLYHGGMELLLMPHHGIVSSDGRWATIDAGLTKEEPGFSETTILAVGRLPWRNIVDYHTRGDEYYNRPHIYCKFDGPYGPFQEIVYYVERHNASWPLDREKRFKYEAAS